MKARRISPQWYFLDKLLLKLFQTHTDTHRGHYCKGNFYANPGFVDRGSLTVYLDSSGSGSFVEADFAACSGDCHYQRKEGVLRELQAVGF